MRRAVHLMGRAFRESGQALDRLGLSVAEKGIFNETFSRHRPVMNLYDQVSIVPNQFIVTCIYLLKVSKLI